MIEILSAYGCMFIILFIFDLCLGILMNIVRIFRVGVSDGNKALTFKLGGWKL